MRLLVGLFVASFLLAGRASAATLPLPPGVTAQVWDPGESYAGGTQADPRLDQPVEFWRAGLTLGEVFAGVTEQTGVEIGFWPADDQNTRVRVNLYLNPDDPPALRDLMAQLQWVTGCPFAFTQDKLRTYCLLSTTEGQAVAGGLQSALRAYPAEQAEWQRRALERMRDKLEEYRGALRLSRAEAISRYQDTDPGMLLNLLEPSRRAMVQFVDGLTAEQLAVLSEKGLLALKGGDLRPDDQMLLAVSFSREPEEVRRGALYISLFAGPSYTGVSGDLVISRADGSSERTHSVHVSMSKEQELGPRDEVALRRELGEEISDQEAQELEDTLQAEKDRQYTDRQNEERRRKLLLSPALSEAARQRLMEFRAPAPFRTGASSTLLPTVWQVQEAVAKATGMHVVSDYFSDQMGAAQMWLGLTDAEYAAKQEQWNEQIRAFGEDHPEEMQAIYASGDDALTRRFPPPTHFVSAPDLLTTWCYGERPEQISAYEPWSLRGWEWGDAGEFLHFRSVCRDAWRGAMWPADVVARVDGWLESYLPKGKPDEKTRVLSVPVRLRDLAWLAQLGDLRLYEGSLICYEDPSDPLGRLREDFRAMVCSAMYNDVNPLRFLGTLSDEQWKLVQGPGLHLGRDITPAQREQTRHVAGTWLSGRANSGKPVRLEACVLKLTPAPDSGDSAAADHYVIEVWVSGKKQDDWHYPPVQTRIVVKLRSLAPLALEKE